MNAHEVREQADLVAVVRDAGVAINERHRGDCPFCKAKMEFAVNEARGFFHCFACKESGSAIDFVMKVSGSSFRAAVDSLACRLETGGPRAR